MSEVSAAQSCPLTSSELEIVRRLADGQSAKEIAAVLGRSHFGINANTKIMRRTVDAKNSAALVAMALRRGWIT